MFAKFNLDLFPTVIVTFKGIIANDDDFDSFLTSWLQINNQQENFIFIFDTSELEIPSVKYCLKMSIFISKLRKLPHQYLQKSLIIINHYYIKYMIDLMFSLQPPVAIVYITQESLKEITKKVIIQNNIFNYHFEDIETLKKFYPQKPFLPFL